MKIRKLGAIFSATVLSASSLLGMGFAPLAGATAANCTWTGATDTKFSTTTNWSGCNSTAPQAGDNLVFDNTSLSADTTLTNDIISGSFGSITFQGSGTHNFKLSGNSFTVAGGISDTMINAWGTISANVVIGAAQTLNVSELSGTLDITGAVTGTAPITKTGLGKLTLEGDNSSFTGGINAGTGAGDVVAYSATALGGGSTGVTITDGATLILGFDTDTTFSTPITVGGNGDGGVFGGAIALTSLGGPGGGVTATLSGPVTLTSNVKVGGLGNRTLKVTGPLSGNYTLTAAAGQNVAVDLASSNNTSQSANGTQQAQLNTVTIAAGDDQPSLGISITSNNEYVIDGTRGSITVANGGILKGSGTVGTLNIYQGGIVAPGHSPGCLSTGNLTISGTYQAEIGGTTACTGYDQLKVTGSVNLSGSTLDTILYNGFKPVKGQTYEIISNDGTDAVAGTFTGLAEGATFKVGTNVFQVTYKGGDGNDVVLSVQSAPDTGFGLVAAHPAITLLTTVAAAGLIFGLAQRTRKATARR